MSSGFRWFSRLLWEVKTSQCKQHGQNVLFRTAQHPPFDYRLCPDLLLENISFNLILRFGFDMDLVVLQIHVTHYLRRCLFFIVCPLMCLTLISLLQQHAGALFTNNKQKEIKNYISKALRIIINELTLVLQGENVPVNVRLHHFVRISVYL